MWDLPRPGLEPVSPALAGGFLTTAPPGKPSHCFLKDRYIYTVFLPHSGPHISESNVLIIQVLLVVSEGDSHHQAKRKHCHLNAALSYKEVSSNPSDLGYSKT